jgi:hypothetical protein
MKNYENLDKVADAVESWEYQESLTYTHFTKESVIDSPEAQYPTGDGVVSIDGKTYYFYAATGMLVRLN